MSHYTCSSCSTPHQLFGSPAAFTKTAADMQLDVLGQVPLVPQVSDGGDAGRPVMVQGAEEGEEVRGVMRDVAGRVWGWLSQRGQSGLGTRG